MMENKGCITCRKCEQVRSNFFCGRTRLSQKQLYNKYGFCTRYEPVEQKPLTNEEYLRSCTTEQLAEFISKIDMPLMDKAPFPCGDLIECNKNCGLYSRCVKDDFPTNKEVWVEWLKQPHTDKEKNAKTIQTKN